MGHGSRHPWRTLGPRVSAAALLTVLLPGAALSSPAQAGAGGCEGVVVVVEPAGAPEQVDCVTDAGGRTAAELIEGAGHELTRVQRFPGAVCRVDGVPADQGCVAMPPADAYWGLFHAEGDSWAYATAGIDVLQPARGDAVALVWQDAATETMPDHVLGAGPVAPASASGREAAEAGEDPAGAGSVPLAVPLLAVGGLLVAAVLVTVRRRGA